MTINYSSLSSKPQHLNNLKIFLDSGDIDKTREIVSQIGFLDGQTTNPSLFAKSLISSNPNLTTNKFTEKELWQNYETAIKEISKLYSEKKSISIEVYMNHDTTVAEILEQAKKLVQWIPQAWIKFPSNSTGIESAKQFLELSSSHRVNMTLGFTEEQLASLYNATANIGENRVFYSVFVGRLIDNGINAIEQIKNMKQLLTKETTNNHIQLLGCSYRSLSQLVTSINAGVDIVTVPASILLEWMKLDFSLETSLETNELIAPQCKNLSLETPYTDYRLDFPLIKNGIDKFCADWDSLLI